MKEDVCGVGRDEDGVDEFTKHKTKKKIKYEHTEENEWGFLPTGLRGQRDLTSE